MKELLVFSGTTHPKLAAGLTKALGGRLGRSTIGAFPDGEISIELHESVKDCVVAVVQSLCSDRAIVELLLLVDALKRDQPNQLILVIPYLRYSRQERRNPEHPGPISMSVIARTLSCSDVNAIITVDVHQPDTLEYFDPRILIKNLSPAPLFAQRIRQLGLDPADAIIVAPDRGARRRAEQLAHCLGWQSPSIVMKKTRGGPTDCWVEQEEIDPQTLRDKIVLLHDDILSSGETLRQNASWFAAHKIRSIWVCVSHIIQLNNAYALLTNTPHIQKIITTNSLPIQQEAYPALEFVDLAPWLSSAVLEIYEQHIAHEEQL